MWLRGIEHVPPAVVGELAGRAAATDGVAAISGHLLEALDTGGVDALLRRDSDGTVVGVAVATGADPGEVVVDPTARRQGHGSALVDAAVQRQGAVWAYGDLPAAAAVARRLNLVRGRVLLQLRRSGSGSAPAVNDQLPAGVRLRTFVPGQDEAAFLEVNARAFAWHPEQGRLDLAGLRAEMAQNWFDPAGFFLAVTDRPPGEPVDPARPDRVVGFHWTKVHEDDPNPGPDGHVGPIGEVYVLGVDPAAGIRGIGTPLTAAGLDHLAGRGLHTVMLYVEGDNDRARRLYERFGFRTFLTNSVYSRSATPAPRSPSVT
jgi:mycothiol synthase